MTSANAVARVAGTASTMPVADLGLEAISAGRTPFSPEPSGAHELSLRQLRSVITELVAALNSTLNDERESAEESLCRAAAILQPLQNIEARTSGPMRTGLAPWQIRRITTHIEANLDKSIRSRDLAALLSLSPSHFSRAFRDSIGDSPLQYLIRRRMERAQGLMLSTDEPLSQIALECGLADQAHFSRLFRRTTGESPTAWRRARVDPGSRSVPVPDSRGVS